MLTLATILSGATSGSTQLTVQLVADNGTPVRVHRGERLIGSAVVTGGIATVALNLSLATGDIVQASVSEKGNRCGSPVTVMPSGVRLTGWKTPTEIQVVRDDGSAQSMTPAQFFEFYGYLPASLYDPAGTHSIVTPEWEKAPVSGIVFDVLVEQQNNQTTVTVQNVQYAKGGVLVRWNGTGNFSNATSKVFTVAGVNTLEVTGTDDETGRVATKTLTIGLLSTPAQPVPDSRIQFYSWRDFGPGIVKLEVNSAVACQSSANGSPFVDMISYALYYQETLYYTIPEGSVVLTIRVTGETDPAKYVVMNFVKGN